ncbi:MAG: glycosyltransferase family 2 protein [Pseudomonadota bacterium]
MTASQKISIVTISYNQAAYLEECLNSVIGQNYVNREYVVVDAGSTDGSRDIIGAHAEHIEHVIAEPDEGPADGLNKGFARAKGSIYGYINADDRLSRGALEFVSHYFDTHPDVDVLCGTIGIIDKNGNSSLRKRTADRFDLARYAAGICVVGQQATFFRSAAYRRAGGFNKNNRITWDGELLVDMALSGARFATVPNILGDFRIYSESITGSNKFNKRFLEEHRRVAKKIATHGIALYPPVVKNILRVAYKANIARHVRYFISG